MAYAQVAVYGMNEKVCSPGALTPIGSSHKRRASVMALALTLWLRTVRALQCRQSPGSDLLCSA